VPSHVTVNQLSPGGRRGIVAAIRRTMTRFARMCYSLSAFGKNRQSFAHRVIAIPDNGPTFSKPTTRKRRPMVPYLGVSPSSKSNGPRLA